MRTFFSTKPSSKIFYASSGTSPGRGGPFGTVVFQVAGTSRLRGAADKAAIQRVKVPS
jgi:hypothetical protein